MRFASDLKIYFAKLFTSSFDILLTPMTSCDPPRFECSVFIKYGAVTCPRLKDCKSSADLDCDDIFSGIFSVPLTYYRVVISLPALYLVV